MKIIIADDNTEFATAIKERIGQLGPVEHEIEIVDSKNSSSVYQIGRDINDLVNPGEKVIVLINLNLAFGPERSRPPNAGIQVLQYLRLSRRFFDSDVVKENEVQYAHCIVYSPFSFETELRKFPGNSIMLSEGVTFASRSELLTFEMLNLEELVEINSNAGSVRNFMRGGCFIPDNRHDLANWWGIKQLWDVHRLIIDSPKWPYPKEITKRFESLENLQAINLYSHSRSDLSSAFDSARDRLTPLRTRILGRKPVILHIDDQWNDGWSVIFSQMCYVSNLTNTKIEIKRHDGDFIVFYFDNVPLLYVYTGFPEIATRKDKLEIISKTIKNFIRDRNESDRPDLILLDLRLLGSEEGDTDTHDLSGATLLKLLRKEFTGIPVIMTTASNKAWNHEDLMRLGADGYWIKEGIDARNTSHDSVSNYERLLILVETATGDKYRFLDVFERSIKNIKETEALGKSWWRASVWSTKKKKPNSTTIIKILEETLQSLRTYLHYFEMGYGFPTLENQDFWAAAIIAKAATILDEIHLLEPGQGKNVLGSDGFTDRRGRETKGRNDWFAMELYEIRNQSVHHRRIINRGLPPLKWGDLTEFLECLICYLMLGPQKNFSPGMTLKKMKRLSPYKDLYEGLK